MRSFARIIAAVLAAMASATWQLIDGTWQLVRAVMGPPQPPLVDEREAPVSAAQAAAEQILAASDTVKAERKIGLDGMTRRFPLGYAVAMAARGVEDHLADVAEAVAAWALALTPDERAAAARFRPDEIEAHINGERRLQGLPAFGTQFEQTVALLHHNVAEARKEAAAGAVQVAEPLYFGPRFS